MSAKIDFPITALSLLILAALIVACSLIPASIDTPQPAVSPSQTQDVQAGDGDSIRELAQVDGIEIQIQGARPIQVNAVIAGTLPDSCTSLGQITQVREGNTFVIRVYTTRPAGAVCAQALQPFEAIVVLNVGGLSPGAYGVDANGIQTQFELPMETGAPPDTASISGLVWHDLCAVREREGGIGPIATVGCVLTGSETDGAYRANGILETNEPGIGGVQVDLGIGPCPSLGFDSTTTTPSGTFSFSDLDPGIYCVSIEPLNANNTAILTPGVWTSPGSAVSRPVANVTITVAPGQNIQNLNFGWDYQFLPEPPELPTPVFTPTPTVPPIPCDLAQFVRDVTVPDRAPYTPDTEFVKTWRLRNIGSCTWTSSYSLVFVSGDPMSSGRVFSLPESVDPGETIDLSVRLTAPDRGGRYKGNWMLRNSSGELFGIGENGDIAFWVSIEVIEPNSDFVYDFAANFCSAEWESREAKLLCPGNSRNTDGFVLLLDNPNLENRSENENTLWTRPNHERNGWISGTYPAIRLREGYRFKSWVGCLDGSEGCNVSFFLEYMRQDGRIRSLGNWSEKFDGKVTEIDMDLSNLAGESVRFILTAEVNNNKFDVANAFWFVPRIEIGEPDPESRLAVLASMRLIASYLQISFDEIEIVSVDGPLEWEDTCLGVHVGGQDCEPASIVGYRVVLELDGKLYEAHTNHNGSKIQWFRIE